MLSEFIRFVSGMDGKINRNLLCMHEKCTCFRCALCHFETTLVPVQESSLTNNSPQRKVVSTYK